MLYFAKRPKQRESQTDGKVRSNLISLSFDKLYAVLPQNTIQIDFDEYDRIMKRGSGGRSLLLKAVGLSKTKGLRILDATAGLARDSFFMAKFGGCVTAIERSPVLVEMIHAAHKKRAGGFEFIAGDAIDLIPRLPPFDVIYLDPMFREEKSAKAKKDLQFLQSLHHGAKEDSADLIKLALATARIKVVVKRARLAPFLGGLKPNWSIQGQSIRFDVYLPNNVQA